MRQKLKNESMCACLPQMFTDVDCGKCTELPCVNSQLNGAIYSIFTVIAILQRSWHPYTEKMMKYGFRWTAN